MPNPVLDPLRSRLVNAAGVIILPALFVLTGCQTQSALARNDVLIPLQEWTTPEPRDSVSPQGEQDAAKTAMVRWIEQYLKGEYQVVDQHFVLTEPGFTEGASIGSKANQYVTQELGGTMQTDGWYDDENYRAFLWTFGEDSPRFIAFVVTSEFLPGTNERRLVGYFELASSRKD